MKIWKNQNSRLFFDVFPINARYPVLKKSIIIDIGQPMSFEKYYGQEKNETVLRTITNEIMTNIGILSGQKYQV